MEQEIKALIIFLAFESVIPFEHCMIYAKRSSINNMEEYKMKAIKYAKGK